MGLYLRIQGTGWTTRLLTTFKWTGLIATAAMIAGGCGGSGGDSGGVPVITITSNRDSTGTFPRILDECTKAANGKYKIEEVILPNPVDQQREQIIRRLAAKDSTLSIIAMDVIWTAEFSEAGWIMDLSKRIEPDKDKYIPASLETAFYKGKYWGVPAGTNAALLFYRKDIIKTPPKTWEELVVMSAKATKEHPEMKGFLWQANQYEGLTVDALEFIYGKQAKVLDKSGKKVLMMDDDKALEAFKFMRQLFADGTTPKNVTTFMEEESRQMFQQGKAVFLRNWPYVWGLSQEDNSLVKGKVGVAPLPAFEDGEAATVLGGSNFGISRYTPHPEFAYEAIQCITNEKHGKDLMLKKGQMSTKLALYDDPDVRRELPFVEHLLAGLKVAHPRPVSPYYNDLTVALNKSVHEVVAGHLSPEDGVKRASEAMALAVNGKGEI